MGWFGLGEVELLLRFFFLIRLGYICLVCEAFRFRERGSQIWMLVLWGVVTGIGTYVGWYVAV